MLKFRGLFLSVIIIPAHTMLYAQNDYYNSSMVSCMTQKHPKIHASLAHHSKLILSF